jgi:glycine/D-amino acid oxidase-like deaminating enzyme
MADNIDGPHNGAAPRQLGVSPSALCPEYARLLEAFRGALIAHNKAVEKLLQVTVFGNHAGFFEAQKAVDCALAEVRSRGGALKEHVRKHEC